MNESILQTIKKLLGITSDYEAFDTDLIIHINSVLSVLYQLGLGKKAFHITGDSELWGDMLDPDETDLEMIKTYVYLKVRKIFDPPTSSSVLQAFEEEIKQLEWRINVAVETKKESK